VNQGGEPAHDDYGLPRVDVEIPDDARELYRDVQAYHRELRALRRHQRSDRWRAPIRRSGMVVPLIAGCLVLAMIAGMVLTMFSANPSFSGAGMPVSLGGRHTGRPAGGSTPASPASPSSGSQAATGAPPSGASQTASLLPGKAISVDGTRIPLRGLTATALAIIPASCSCRGVVKRLISQAMSAGVTVYLVGKLGSLTELNSLAPASTRGTAKLAIDADNALTATYRPYGLTLLLVDSHGGVTVTPRLRPNFQIEKTLESLKPTS